MRIIGLFICGLLLAIPLIHFLPLLATHNAVAVFSQYMGFFAFIAMAQIMVLATRWPFVEPLFGGLDRVYLLHKWLGLTALATAFLHETFDAEIKGLELGTGLSERAEDVGEFGYNSLLILVAITLTTFIPYHWWRQSHKLMGAIFVLCAFHSYFIEKSFTNISPLGLYILVLSIFGIIAYVYTLIPPVWLKRMHPYRVESIEDAGDAVSVTLKPIKKSINHNAGQFAFLRIANGNHNEIHPFTISNGPSSDCNLRFTIKPLGNGTQKLADAIEIGQYAQVSQPFGRFRYTKIDRIHFWIAGGIGITPFLAWAQALPVTHGAIYIFVCCRSKEDVAHLDELNLKAATDPNLHVIVFESNNGKRLSAREIVRYMPDPKRAVISFCGPSSMREALRHQLIAKGVKRGNFHYEEFEIRSSLPLSRIWRLGAFLLRCARNEVRNKVKGQPLRRSG